MMPTLYLWLTPLAVLVVLLLVGFVGCNQIFGLDEVTIATYSNEVPIDTPLSWWRLQETSASTVVPGGAAVDDRGLHDGVYVQQAAPAAADPTTMSPPANPIVLSLGEPGLIATEHSKSSIRVQGAGVTVPFAADLNPFVCTYEVLVAPEWDLNSAAAQGNYYCVFEATNQQDAGSGLPKNAGIALYAGPDDPATPNTPYRWQVWTGDGTTFQRRAEVDPNDGTLVIGGVTYLCVTFDGTTMQLFVYRENADIDQVKHVLAAATYMPNQSGDLTIGFTAPRRALVGPSPGPDRELYSFNGRLEEFAIYDRALSEGRILGHLLGGFEA